MSSVVQFCDEAAVDTASLMRRFRPFRRLCSYLALRAAGFPTLPSVIVTSWSAEVERNFLEVMAALSWRAGVLRSDLDRNQGRKPPGGDLYSLDEIKVEIVKILQDGRMPWIFAPVSRFDNLYSGNVLWEPHSDEFAVEIVGPGFDLSDINRSHTNPHESFVIYSGALRDGALTLLDVRSHTVTDQASHKVSWDRRVQRVSSMLGVGSDRASVVRETMRELSRCGHTLLEAAKVGYRPIGYETIAEVDHWVSQLPFAFAAEGASPERLTLGFGVLRGCGLFFWDYFRPSDLLSGGVAEPLNRPRRRINLRP